MFSLRKIQSRRPIGKLSPNLALKAFDSLILPILEYGGEILYTGKKIDEYEKIHLNFLKALLGVNKQTPTLAVLGDTGRFPLLLRQKIRAIGYWIRIVSLLEHHHLKIAYQCLLNSHLEGRVNWASHVKAI